MCVAYCRVSTSGQIGGDGFARQDAAIVKLCEQKGWDYIAAYVEYGVTGDSNLEGREALGALSISLENGCPKLVVIEHPDRMARGMMAGLTILDDMRQRGATVICACDGREWTVDDKDPEAVLFWGIRQMIAQYEKMRLVAKLKSARMRMKISTGRCEGAKPFGMLPGEEAAMARFWELAERTTSPTELARRLNDSAVPTRTGARWDRQRVQKMLKRARQIPQESTP